MKNSESLSNELKELGANSTLSLSKKIFQHCSDVAASVGNDNKPRTSIRGMSVASQFRSSLQNLVSDLEQTSPHYIRCVKPNLSKTANSFDAGEVLRQLRYAGMMEAIRIRREGYALREAHESFYNRFNILLDVKDRKEGEGISHLVSVLSKRLFITDVDWQIGHSKIFLRRKLADKLERLALLRVHCAARTLGRFGRLVAERRAAKLLVPWCRFRLHLLKKNRERKAATKIQATFKMQKQKSAFNVTLSLVCRAQSFVRKRQAVNYVKKLRNPYGEMTFNQVESLYNDELGSLNKAVSAKNFTLAASLENKV